MSAQSADGADNDADGELVQAALAGRSEAVRRLVDRLTPVVQKRVVAALWRRAGSRRDARQEVEDMTQEVFLSLFGQGGKALRAWDPRRGLSLDGFVGMLAQHQVSSVLRTGRTSPWRDDPTDDDEIQALAGSQGAAGGDPERLFGSRELLEALLDRVRSALSPLGLELFQRMVVEEESLDSLLATTGMTKDALYKWKSRLVGLVRQASADLLAVEPPPMDRGGAAGAAGAAAEQRTRDMIR